MPSPSTFTTQDESYLIKSWKANRDWFRKSFLSRASFRRSPVSKLKYFTVLPLHISNIYAKKKSIAKKLILALRAIMISQEVHVVASDFNGTAWRYRSRENLNTIDEVFTDCALSTHSAEFSNHRVLIHSGRCACMMHSPSHGKLGLRPTDQSCHRETWLHKDFVDCSNMWSKQGAYEPRTSLKERLANCSYGNPKRRICEVMSDHSLSS